MFRYLTVVIFLFLSANLCAQDNYGNKQTLSFGYLGEKVLHFGAQVGYTQGFTLSKKHVKHGLELGGQLFVYTHPKNHIGLRLAPSVGYNYTASKDWNFGLTTDFGFFYRFYNGAIYTVDESGDVKKQPFGWQSNLSYGIYLSSSKDFYKNQKLEWGICCNVGFFKAINTSTAGIMHPVLAVGLKKYFSYEQ